MEAAVLVLALVLFVTLVVSLAEDALTRQAVTSAAFQGARAASLERTPAAARSAAEIAVGQALSESGVECRASGASVDTSGLRSPVGTVGSVAVSVSCQYRVASLPGVSGERSFSDTGVSPVDRYRGR